MRRSFSPPHGSTPAVLVALAVLVAGLQAASPATNAVATHHWAFQPVRDPAPPAVRNKAWARTRIDTFLLAAMEAEGRHPAPRAEPATLIRRLTYDLTGLPPTSEEIEAFQRDPSPQGVARVVDRLLASPRYGEQWGRHWLDVVRYADTAGENTDHPLPHAWRYRNWVIDAFNRDLPYDEFIRQQVAGDLLPGDGSEGEFARRTVATGYLAIARRFGHDIDQDMHLTFEDTIDTLGKSVLGLTLGCARCHDHKYDPVSTRDYYGLYGIFQSTRFAFPGCEPRQLPHDLVPLLPTAAAQRLMAPFLARQAELTNEVQRLATALAERQKSIPMPKVSPLASGDLPGNGREEFAVGGGEGKSPSIAVHPGDMLQLTVLPKANHGADSTGLEIEIRQEGPGGERWSLTEDLLRQSTGEEDGARFPDSHGRHSVWQAYDLVPGPTLFTQFIKDGEKTPGLNIWRGSEGVPSLVINLNPGTVKFVTITMPGRSIGVHPGPNGGVAIGWASPIEGRVSVRGKIAKIDPGGDGIAWQLFQRPGIASALAAQSRDARALAEARTRLEEFNRTRPVVPVAYAVAEGNPTNARIQKRGEPKDPGDEVPRKFLDLLGGEPVAKDSKGSGRLDLARWLTAPGNPLTARVMVNRIWEHHFGRGLVASPNDFGTRGRPPTHPALLDHLASEFVRKGWSVKELHRLILLSSAYAVAGAPEPGHGARARAPASPAEARPAAMPHPPTGTSASLSRNDSLPAATSDPEADYSTFRRRRLTAEEIRDSLLAVTGELDLVPGEGHPFPPEEKWGFTQHGPFAADYDTLKRSVYVMMKRNKRHPFFALFDGADPNASTPVRDRTTVPTQSLYFMNDPFLHARAAKLAGMAMASATGETARAEWLVRRVMGRAATRQDLREASTFLHDYATACADQPASTRPALAWAAYARVLLASNEFLHID